MRSKWMKLLAFSGAMVLTLILAFCVLAVWYIWQRPPPAQSNTEPKGAHYLSVEGLGRIAYWKINASAPKKTETPILYLEGGPGIGISEQTISSLSEQFPDFDIYFLDQIGVGASDRLPQRQLTLENSVKSIHKFSKDIIRQPAILFGGSWGAGIATRVSIAHPDIVQGLVLVSPISLPETCKAASSTRPKECLRYRIPTFEQSLEPKPLTRLEAAPQTPSVEVSRPLPDFVPTGRTTAPIDRLWLAYIVAPISPWLSEKMLPLSERKQWEIDGRSYEVNLVLKRQHMQTPIVASSVSESLPVLVLRGELDFEPLREVGGYQLLFPNSRVIEFKKETHELNLESCAVLIELRQFLAKHAGSREPVSCINQLVPVPNVPDAYTIQTMLKLD